MTNNNPDPIEDLASLLVFPSKKEGNREMVTLPCHVVVTALSLALSAEYLAQAPEEAARQIVARIAIFDIDRLRTELRNMEHPKIYKVENNDRQ